MRGRFLHECTSYAVSCDRTRDGAILFHKNRDNRQCPQAACIVASSLMMGQSRTPACLLDGSAYQLGAATQGGSASWEALERPTHADKERLKKTVAATLAVGKADRTVKLLEQ